MKLVIDIPDKQESFAIQVLKSLSFVKGAKPMTLSSYEFWGDLKEAVEEVKLHKQGKIRLTTAHALLDEL